MQFALDMGSRTMTFTRSVQAMKSLLSPMPCRWAAMDQHSPRSVLLRVLEKPMPATPGTQWRHSSSDVGREDASDILLSLESALGPLDSKPIVPPSKPVVVVISGPSGVGKDSVLTRLKQKREDLYFVVTATSRPMRPLEVEGKDYFFVTRDKFETWIAEKQLLEHALVYGDYKGIPRQQVDQALATGTDVILRIDVQGAATVKALMPEAITVFVAAESQASLVERLAARKTETMDKMIIRVQTAQREMDQMKSFDYVVVNKDGALDSCAEAIGAIIDAEKAKVSRLMS